MTDHAKRHHIPPAPLDWLIILGSLLAMDLTTAIPEGFGKDGIHAAIDDLRRTLQDARICQPGMASLKGDSFSRGCFTIQRGGIFHSWWVWVRAQSQGEGTSRFGHEGTVFMIDPTGRLFWAGHDADAVLALLKDILQASDLQLRGSVR